MRSVTYLLCMAIMFSLVVSILTFPLLSYSVRVVALIGYIVLWYLAREKIFKRYLKPSIEARAVTDTPMPIIGKRLEFSVYLQLLREYKRTGEYSLSLLRFFTFALVFWLTFVGFALLQWVLFSSMQL